MARIPREEPAGRRVFVHLDVARKILMRCLRTDSAIFSNTPPSSLLILDKMKVNCPAQAPRPSHAAVQVRLRQLRLIILQIPCTESPNHRHGYMGGKVITRSRGRRILLVSSARFQAVGGFQ